MVSTLAFGTNGPGFESRQVKFWKFFNASKSLFSISQKIRKLPCSRQKLLYIGFQIILFLVDFNGWFPISLTAEKLWHIRIKSDILFFNFDLTSEKSNLWKSLYFYNNFDIILWICIKFPLKWAITQVSTPHTYQMVANRT